jgi:hypothetical protein
LGEGEEDLRRIGWGHPALDGDRGHRWSGRGRCGDDSPGLRAAAMRRRGEGRGGEEEEHGLRQWLRKARRAAHT